MQSFLSVGDQVTFSKTVGESDVYLFAGITGDFAPNHIDEAFMRKSAFGRRIAHGALLVGYMSTASTKILERNAGAPDSDTPVSLGYDRVRFVRPVYIGDTITVRYVVESVDPDARRTRAKIEVCSEDGRIVAVAEHIMKWVPNSEDQKRGEAHA
jgi:3-hydroxybutyryl-CoA dehydratase